MGKKRLSDRQLGVRRAFYGFFRAITVLTLLVITLVAGVAVGVVASVMKDIPDDTDLADIRPPAPSRILASDGTVLARVYSENREVVPYERMKHMINATLAIEDIRFFEHKGIDPKGIMRAMVKNAAHGDIKEGASTITQQLARRLYLTLDQEVGRKVQEMIIALELERRYSKMEILEAYLNQVYYGSNTNSVQFYGVQTAAKNLFGKNVDELSISEAALLAGLPKNPLSYNPYRHPEAAKNRRDTVLYSMWRYGFINEHQYREARNEPITLAPEKKLTETADYDAPYFVRYILHTEIPRIFGQDARDLMYNYGIDVYTTLDPRMQEVADEVVAKKVNESRGRNIDDGALISIDPKTGYIKAMVGGTDFRYDEFNIATQGKRQPGSAFKPFVYTTALLHGYTPDTIVKDSPGSYPSGTGQYWSPKNSDGGFRGAMPLKQALWLSRNAAAARVAYDVGIDKIIEVAHRMGIEYKLSPYLSTSLGASVVVPLEICSAYGTLANGGVHNPATGIVRIVSADGGELLYEHRPTPRRAIPTEIADTMQEMMRGVIERGTARSARIPYPASGKTGTTNSYRDAWFIGYTDDLVTAVWVGNRRNLPMSRVFGGTIPAPIWRDFMLVALPIIIAEHEVQQTELARANHLPELASVDTTPTPYIQRLHRNQQARAAERQRQRELEAALEREREAELAQEETEQSALPASAPEEESEVFQVLICSDTGLRATPDCPNTELRTYKKGRAPSPPAATCTQHGAPKTEPAPDAPPPAAPREERGITLSICAETGKLATDRCPIIIQRRFTSETAPRETCPLHGR